jgi:ribosomal protein L37E
MSGKKQYVIAMITIYTLLALPLWVLYIILQQYFIWSIAIGILTVILFLFQKSSTRKSIDNYVATRTLYKKFVNRKCNNCGYDDTRTRDKTKPAKIYDSAYAPCERCGSTDFEFRKMHF